MQAVDGETSIDSATRRADHPKIQTEFSSGKADRLPVQNRMVRSARETEHFVRILLISSLSRKRSA